MRTPNKKMSWLLGSAALFSLLSTASLYHEGLWPTADNDLTRSIRKKLAAYLEIRAEERIYLQADRPFYEPGDDIWLSVWLRDGKTLKPSEQSDIVTVDLISPKGSVERTINLIAKNGLASGDFSLGADMPGGLYKLRAYTQWMKNDGEQRWFEKEIQVQEVVLPALKMKLDFVKRAYGAGDLVEAMVDVSTNENKPLSASSLKYQISIAGKIISEEQAQTDAEGHVTLKFRLPSKLTTSDALLNVLLDYNGSTESISRAVPVVRNEISLAFYPEGGDIVNGLPSRVAFRAANEFGKPADIDGELIDGSGKVLSKFSTYHMGMGSFNFTASAGQNYFVKITRPAGIATTYQLPEQLDRGTVMQVQKVSNDAIRVQVRSTERGEMSLVGQVRGKVVYTAPLTVAANETSIDFSVADMPMGVMQLTLFDKRGIARAERLFFVNSHRQLSVSIRPDKQKYLPREKVKLNILVKDERGLPAPALLSLSVVNDQLLSFADDKSGNIVSSLLLQDDIKERVDEPAFYFDRKQAKAREALDLLMMTAGWRRFTWEDVLDREIPAPQFLGQRAVISGQVLDANSGQPVQGVSISAGTNKWTTDANGRCEIRGEELYNPLSITLQKNGYQQQVQQVYDYGENHTWYIYDHKHRIYSRLHEVPMMEMASAVPGDARVANMRDNVAKKSVGQPKALNGRQARPVAANAKQKEIRHEGKLRAGADFFDREAEPDFQGQATKYYRARQFAAPLYVQDQPVAVRTDFRNTIYWNPRIEVGHNGRQTVEFYASDDITSYRVTAEGVSTEGQAGRGEEMLFTQLPFQLLTKIPSHLTGGDVVQLPVTLKNNTAKPLGGVMRASLPPQLSIVKSPDSVQTIMPGEAKTLYYTCKVKQGSVDTTINIGFSACAMSDQLSAKVSIRPRGFPVSASFGGQHLDKEYTLVTDNVVENSLRITLSAYPDVISDLMKGVEGILREPYGCFEQTSCTAYPNAMVLNYLKGSGSNDSRLLASAGDLLDRGYKRLTTFETPSKGYEWFGSSPAHEGLTAYGIMEFMDMKRAGQKIDEQMLERTARWLLNHRDGQGGFTREKRALHDFGRISDEVMNTYIVYALADAGYKEIVPEFEKAVSVASSSGDSYLITLAANAAFRLNRDKEAAFLMQRLLREQAPDGSFTGSSHSITYSQGRSLSIETTALAIMAMLESKATPVKELEKSVRWLLSMRDGSGSFSSTQGTILALKALTSYAIFNKRAKESGEIVVYIDGKRVANSHYKAGERGEVVIAGLEKYLDGEGNHRIRVKFNGVEQPLPYSISAEWFTTLPQSDKDCALTVNAQMISNKVKVGETARLQVTVTNNRSNDLPSAIAVVGIPAGLSVQPWQLKELQEKMVFDYYEILGNRLALYYRGVGPAVTHQINLDLKAEMPGEFHCPATSAYLYYTNELKSWSGGQSVMVSAK